MFKIKTKIKDEVIVKDSMYFTYGLTMFKLSKIVNDRVKIAFYDESSGNLNTIEDSYTVSFIQEAILQGKYVPVIPGYEFTIPDKLRDYVVQH